MIIYRVENTNGRGFYHDGFYANFPPVQRWYPNLRYCSEEAVSYFINKIHPTVSIEYEEIVYNENSNFVFGFLSKQEMEDWFPISILDGVILKKGKIQLYEVDKKYVKILNKQCIFDISKSVLLQNKEK